MANRKIEKSIFEMGASIGNYEGVESMSYMKVGKRVHSDVLHKSLLERGHHLELVDDKVNFVLMLDEWMAEDDTDMAYYRCPLNEITDDLIEQGFFHDEQGKLQYDESIIDKAIVDLEAIIEQLKVGKKECLEAQNDN